MSRFVSAATGFWLFVLVVLSFISPPIGSTKDQPELKEPKLLSGFPLTGRKGSTVRVEIRGNLLGGAYEVWLETANLQGRLLKVKEIKAELNQEIKAFQKVGQKPPIIFRALIEVDIKPTTHVGRYALRLVTPRGISDALLFRVVDHPVVVETASPHQTVQHAQAVGVPVIIDGKLEKPGELDYYSFHAKRGQELSLEVMFAENCEPRLALYRGGGSWLDPNQPRRLLTQEEKSSDLIQQHALGTFVVPQDGEYFLEVSSLFGKGTADSTYQVRLASRNQTSRYQFSRSESSLNQMGGEWEERSFARELNDSWMANLKRREVETSQESIAPSKGETSVKDRRSPERRFLRVLSPPARSSSALKRELNEGVAQAQPISIPSLIDGAIERPGDVDNFKFKVEPGQKLAFEVETPETKPPYFNPRFVILDSHGHELFSNLKRRTTVYSGGGIPDVYLKALEPKAVYTFDRGGEYLLRIRDITSRYGDASYRYRILIRPEVPHVGEILVIAGEHVDAAKPVSADRINLIRGRPKKLTIIASYEEGFVGDLSFAFEGLPEAVQVFPAVQLTEERPAQEVTQNADIIEPKRQRTTLILLASPDASLTYKPVIVHLYCRPIAERRLGADLLVREMPLMVVDVPASQKTEGPEKGGEKSEAGQ
jgi:hypothetical protein